MPFFHVWFATKRRRKLLFGDVLDVAREEIAAAAKAHEIHLIEHECVIDHAHLLLELEGLERLPKAMNYIKGASSRRIFQRMDYLKMDAGINNFWQAKYGWKEIDRAAIPSVGGYIRTQWDRLDDYLE